MSEERHRILEMLSQGKINVDEAERLLKAVEPGAAEDRTHAVAVARKPKYLRVMVEEAEKGEIVNVRVPIQVLRAGVKLGALIPHNAFVKVDGVVEAHGGIPFDLNNLSPENIEELIDALSDGGVDVNIEQGKVRVRIFCE